MPWYIATVLTSIESYRRKVSSTTAIRAHRGMAARPSTSFHSRRESTTGSRGRRRRSNSHSGPNTSGRARRTSTS